MKIIFFCKMCGKEVVRKDQSAETVVDEISGVLCGDCEARYESRTDM